MKNTNFHTVLMGGCDIWRQDLRRGSVSAEAITSAGISNGIGSGEL